MKNLVDHIIDELEADGIHLHEDVESNIYHHEVFDKADRTKVKTAIARAITKSLMDDY